MGIRTAGADRSGWVAAAPDQDDERLVAGIVAGDQRAFTEIVRRHAGRLRALALGFSAGSMADADDIVQETFWSLWRHAGRWRPGEPPLSAYLVRIAMNRAIDISRRRRVRSFFGIEEAAEVADPRPPADEQVAAGAELAAVLRDLGDLPARQRVAILLVAKEEWTNAAVAHAMGLSVGAVEQLLVRARKTLRNRLDAREQGKSGR
jgi:RNA polymerase sigma-70 factor (ECF subfamily)